MKYVIFVKVLKSDRITYTSQNKSKKFLSLLVYICVNNITLSPIFIYKDNSGLL